MYAHNRPLTSCAMDRDGSDFVASGTWQISDCPITAQSLELRVMTELARARGAEPPPAVVIPPARRSLLEIAIENSVEGCVRECWGASCARFPGRCGTGPPTCARPLCASPWKKPNTPSSPAMWRPGSSSAWSRPNAPASAPLARERPSTCVASSNASHPSAGAPSWACPRASRRWRRFRCARERGSARRVSPGTGLPLPAV